MISPTRPYSSQRVPNSNLLTRSSVCSREHRPLSPSKSVRFAVHLEKEMVKAWDREWTEYIPSAPPLHNAGKQNLLRVISNIQTKAVDCLPKVTIRTSYHLWNCHSRFKFLQNKRVMNGRVVAEISGTWASQYAPCQLRWLIKCQYG